MRTIAIILSSIGFYLLLRLADLTVLPLVPLHLAGLEAGLIEASLDLVVGVPLTLVALVFALLHFRRTRAIKSSRWLLGWCCFVLLGFLMVFLLMSVGHVAG